MYDAVWDVPARGRKIKIKNCHELDRQVRRHRDATMVTSARVLLGDELPCHETSGEPSNYNSWTILTGLAAL
jgi:hypothetical protein